MKGWLYASLFVFSLLMGCEPQDWSNKDADFLIAKLESWHPYTRGRATWYLEDKTEQRDKIIAALTDVLLNDTHEVVRSEAARALSRMTPPAAEAVPELIEALNLPIKDRGKLIWLPLVTEVWPLPVEVKEALEKIGTPEALEGLEEWKKLRPKLIESSVSDGASGIDPKVINENGITLRFRGFRGNIDGDCDLFDPAGTRLRASWSKKWSASFTTNTVTLKPRRGDPKLVNGTVYKVEVRAKDDFVRSFRTRITFTTKP